ncbi:MAG: DNA primase [Candidatus Campbellbacteria bacterium]|nr:DNA primase [Candidatus Campbellbacteria bacterium]
MKHQNSIVDEIKSRLSMQDVASQYVKLVRAGKNMKGKSPFSNEKTPSFIVSPDKNLFYCFSTNRGGDIFTFIQEVEGLDFKDAVKLLAERSGIDPNEYSYKTSTNKNEINRLRDVLKEANKFFSNNHTDQSKKYLETRGVSQKSINFFEIGYAPSNNSLIQHLVLKGFTKEEVIKAGLAKQADNKDIYSHFRDRVMFPIKDTEGNVISFSGRLIKENKNAGKYINGPETILYKKSRALYGIYEAKQNIRKYKFSIIVEGHLDVVFSAQADYANALAVCGTAMTDEHIMVIKRFSDNILFAFDADEAGLKALHRAALKAVKNSMTVKVVGMPENKDPADIINEDSSNWKKVIRESADVFDFFIAQVKKEGDVVKQIKKTNELVFSLINASSDDLLQATLLNKVSKEFDVPIDDVRRQYEKTKENKVIYTQKTPNPQTDKLPKEKLSNEFFAYLSYIKTNSIECKDSLKNLIEEITEEYMDEKNPVDPEVAALRFEQEYPDETHRVSNMLIALEEITERLFRVLLKERQNNIAKAIDEADSENKEKFERELYDILNKLKSLEKHTD